VLDDSRFNMRAGWRYSSPEPFSSDPTFTPSVHHHTSRS
jgi:hypothetical protein